jgi:hypothetical protein
MRVEVVVLALVHGAHLQPLEASAVRALDLVYDEHRLEPSPLIKCAST